jgi:hypothetical protein
MLRRSAHGGAGRVRRGKTRPTTHQPLTNYRVNDQRQSTRCSDSRRPPSTPNLLHVASTLHIGGFTLEADWVEAWGTWVGGVGTIAAVIWAMYALRREARRGERDKREAQDLQARTVVMYQFRHDTQELEKLKESHIGYAMKVGNYGNTHISELDALLVYGPTGVGVGSTRIQRVLPAGSERTVRFQIAERDLGDWAETWQDHRDYSDSCDPFEILVSWSDIYGQRWSRSYGKGSQPTRVTASPSMRPRLRSRVRAAGRARRGS